MDMVFKVLIYTLRGLAILFLLLDIFQAGSFMWLAMVMVGLYLLLLSIQELKSGKKSFSYCQHLDRCICLDLFSCSSLFTLKNIGKQSFPMFFIPFNLQFSLSFSHVTRDLPLQLHAGPRCQYGCKSPWY